MELKAVHISKIYRQLKPKRFDALKNVGKVKDNSKGKNISCMWIVEQLRV